MTKDEIIERIQTLVNDNLNIPVELLGKDVDLFDNPDFEFDSVDEQELLADIEVMFKCKMVDRIRENFRTIDKVADQVIIACKKYNG